MEQDTVRDTLIRTVMIHAMDKSMVRWSPDAVEHVTIGKYPDVEIRSQDIVKTTDLLISKESVWHPDFCGIDQCQILDLI